ncbi:MAG: MOSC domain-containing protein [Bacteroidetes bacterium]|nr:MOSC domain-containing protein [Bacteroidota bacterium]
MQVSQLVVYPIKGMAGISLEEARLSDTGIKWDRHFMLTDEAGIFLSQRSEPILSQFKTSFIEDGIGVELDGHVMVFDPKTAFEGGKEENSRLFDNYLKTQQADADINQWFSDALGKKVTLVRPAQARFVNNHPDSRIHFPDSSQILLLGQASLDLLNTKLDTSLNIDRFRANIIFTGGEPHQEDGFRQMRIGDTSFDYVKACGRCKVTTIDQQTGEKGMEPLNTLNTYRKSGKSILFGVYLKWTGGGDKLQVGDSLRLENS